MNPRNFLIAAFFILCTSLHIGSIVPVRSAHARPASEAGWIVFTRGDGCVWVMDAATKNDRQIMVKGRNYYPDWSPDGQRIAFTHHPDSDSGGIYIMNADGSKMRPLTDERYDINPDWSPDGRRIAFERQVRGYIRNQPGPIITKNSSVYVIDSDGTDLRGLTAESPVNLDRQPSWSPDGAKIAFERSTTEETGGRIPQIWVMDSDGSNQRKLNDWGQEPVWSPDGRNIAFLRREMRIIGDERKHFSSISVMDADGANVRMLTDSAWIEKDLAWSPNGREILFVSNKTENFEICAVDVDSSRLRQITTTPDKEYDPDWTVFPYALEPAGKLKATWGWLKQASRQEIR